jgi:hypothetical protein
MALEDRQPDSKKKRRKFIERKDAVGKASAAIPPWVERSARQALGPGTAPPGYKADEMDSLLDMSNRNYGYSPAFLKRIELNNPRMVDDLPGDAAGQYEGPGYEGYGGISISDKYSGQQETLTHEGLHDIWQRTVPERRKLIMARIEKMLGKESKQGRRIIQDMDGGKAVGPKQAIDNSRLLSAFKERFTGPSAAWEGYAGYTGKAAKSGDTKVTKFDPAYQNEIFAELPQMYSAYGLEMPNSLAELYKPFFKPNRKTRRDKLANKIMRHTVGLYNPASTWGPQ